MLSTGCLSGLRYGGGLMIVNEIMGESPVDFFSLFSLGNEVLGHHGECKLFVGQKS